MSPNWCGLCLHLCEKTYFSFCCQESIICIDCFKDYLYELHQKFTNKVLCPFCQTNIITYIIILDILKDIYNEEIGWVDMYVDNLIQFFTTSDGSNYYMKDTNNYQLLNNDNISKKIFKKIVYKRKCGIPFKRYDRLVKTAYQIKEATILMNLYRIKGTKCLIVLNKTNLRYEVLIDKQY